MPGSDIGIPKSIGGQKPSSYTEKNKVTLSGASTLHKIKNEDHLENELKAFKNTYKDFLEAPGLTEFLKNLKPGDTFIATRSETKLQVATAKKSKPKFKGFLKTIARRIFSHGDLRLKKDGYISEGNVHKFNKPPPSDAVSDAVSEVTDEFGDIPHFDTPDTTPWDLDDDFSIDSDYDLDRVISEYGSDSDSLAPPRSYGNDSRGGPPIPDSFGPLPDSESYNSTAPSVKEDGDYDTVARVQVRKPSF